MRHDAEAEAAIKNAGIKNLSACERMVTVIEIVGPNVTLDEEQLDSRARFVCPWRGELIMGSE
jgi:hypothetical protein